MAYILSGTSIRRPLKLTVTNSTQFAQVRTLSGAVNRDYFGDNKKVWSLSYDNTNPTDQGIIDSIYQTYLSTGTVVSWEITEANYTVPSTLVHVDLQARDFSTGGSSYISGFALTLSEA